MKSSLHYMASESFWHFWPWFTTSPILFSNYIKPLSFPSMWDARVPLYPRMCCSHCTSMPFQKPPFILQIPPQKPRPSWSLLQLPLKESLCLYVPTALFHTSVLTVAMKPSLATYLNFQRFPTILLRLPCLFVSPKHLLLFHILYISLLHLIPYLSEDSDVCLSFHWRTLSS